MQPSYVNKILYLALILAPSIDAKLVAQDPFFDWLASEKKAQKKENFSGLSFVLPEGWSCGPEGAGKLLCRFQSLSLELIFEKVLISSRASVPLIRMQRKRLWEKETINHYVEENISSTLGVHLGHWAYYYRLNNILSPVLIRAFDVVVDDNTCVSITSKCDVRDWPVFEKEVARLVASFGRTAKN